MVATAKGGGQRMKQGSKVQVTQNAPDCAVFAGQSGEIEKVDREDGRYPYQVRFEVAGNTLLIWFRADELEETR